MDKSDLLRVAADHAAVTVLVRCLEARREQPCPDTNDMALNALDCLHKVVAGLLLAGLPQQQRSALLLELCEALAGHDTPLRIRASAAGVLQNLASQIQNQGALAQAAGMCLVVLPGSCNNVSFSLLCTAMFSSS